MKKLLILFFALVLSVGGFAQNGQLIRDIERYIFEVDSLIEHCRDCFEIGEWSTYSEEMGHSGYVTYHRKPSVNYNYMKLVDSIIRNTSGNIGSKEWHYELDRQIDAIPQSTKVLERHPDNLKYFQNDKLVAIKETNKLGAIILYINNGKVIYHKGLKQDVESIMQKHKLLF